MKVIKKMIPNENIFDATKLNEKVSYYENDVMKYYEIGDWCVVNSDNSVKYYTDEEFNKIFAKVPRQLLND